MRKRGLVAAGIVSAALLAALLRGLLRRFDVVEDSMRPTLEQGDWIVTQRFRGVPDRGDVVVFADPSGGSPLVKRVIGLPGEQLEVANGQVHIGGGALAEPWANGPTLGNGTWDVPQGQVWLLGDNRAAAAVDSRRFGPVDLSTVDWKVVARYRPVSRVGLVR